jgi:hypothetical protein
MIPHKNAITERRTMKLASEGGNAPKEVFNGFGTFKCFQSPNKKFKMQNHTDEKMTR